MKRLKTGRQNTTFPKKQYLINVFLTSPVPLHLDPVLLAVVVRGRPAVGGVPNDGGRRGRRGWRRRPHPPLLEHPHDGFGRGLGGRRALEAAPAAEAAGAFGGELKK